MMASKNTCANCSPSPQSTVLHSLRSGSHWHRIYIKKHLETHFPLFTCGSPVEAVPLRQRVPQTSHSQQHDRAPILGTAVEASLAFRSKLKCRMPSSTHCPPRQSKNSEEEMQILLSTERLPDSHHLILR